MTATSFADHPTLTFSIRRRVLVVDDQRLLRDVYSAALRAAGYDVVGARDGNAALAVIDGMRPDVVVTDVAMPGMDGLELVRTLRARGITVPVLVMSAGDPYSGYAAAVGAGADGYLAKPFALTDLLARTKALVSR